MRADGYIDILFSLPQARGTGAATRLYQTTAHASLLAQPFIANHGWRKRADFHSAAGAHWEAACDLRLHALATEPGVFGARYADQGLRRSATLQAVLTDREDPDGRTALFAMLYIKPEYRGRGLSRFIL